MNTKRIVCAGDLFVGKRVKLDTNIIRLFKSSDLTIVNLEAPIVSDPGAVSSPKAGPSLKQNNDALDVLLESLKVNLFVCSNNHISDYGEKGIRETIKYLDSHSCSYIGVGENKNNAFRSFDMKGTNLTFINVSEEEFGVAGNDNAGTSTAYSDDIIRLIKKNIVRNKNVVVICHGGGEEIPLPSVYIRNRYREFIEYGASLVIGHHPHVAQGMEKYKHGTIYYSLGNFVHTSFNKSLGLVLELKYSGGKISIKEIAVECLKEKLNIVSNDKWLKIKEYYNRINSETLFKKIYQIQSLDMYKRYYKDYLNKANDNPLLMALLFRNNSHRDFINQALKLVNRVEKAEFGWKERLIYMKMKSLIK